MAHTQRSLYIAPAYFHGNCFTWQMKNGFLHFSSNNVKLEFHKAQTQSWWHRCCWQEVSGTSWVTLAVSFWRKDALSFIFTSLYWAEWFDFQRRQASLAPTDFNWNDNFVSLHGQGVTSPSYKTNFRHLTTQTLFSVSLQMKTSGHNSLESSFLSHKACKINLGTNHPSLTITEPNINPLWTFAPSSMQLQDTKLIIC